MRGKAWLAVLALALVLPSSGVALASGGAPSLPGSAGNSGAATSTTAVTMVEGRVLSASGTALTILTPAEGPFCRPPMMCPDFLRAPVRYEVDASTAKVFGNFLGGLSLQALRPGATVVVYGTVQAVPASRLSKTGQPTLGMIRAEGIFVLAVPFRPVPFPLKPGSVMRSPAEPGITP